MASDILDKKAILQRDRESYAIVPHTPAGIISADELQCVVDVARKYGATIKFTSAQRVALIGLKENDLEDAWSELGMKPASSIGRCVRSIKVCPGITNCKRAQQDAMALGLKLDELYHGIELPSKFKMAVSGCMNSCSGPAVKDIGVMGTPRGFTLLAGGNAGIRPRIGDVIAEGLDEVEALEMVGRIIEFYMRSAKKYRLGRLIDDIGLDVFKNEVRIV
ncbi:NAD(P)/FAD-dependent oxidoreductase [Methanococcoides burtonii]|uniref:Sulfite reductase, assimilatory-type n=1 Tax=Methanococcoides burtonii (strain DSM 6242 / NBRC 107633 / OCM 468 / ACE-M) TaxID=259564 RepID=Q12TE0_METBU|nr:NAD(P)/FAD-dependent oxidoreductase [Methanococcoides burtonii]ABE53286.1 Sulfite reductase, assimilatory-type [Methanococcoides burtonii DSM 6242]